MQDLSLDYSLNKEAFGARVDDLIRCTQSEKTVIPLPLTVDSMQAGLAVVCALLSQVNCDGCKAKCCNSLPGDIYLLPSEQEYLSMKSLTPPCPFLRDNRCSIYENRPLTCIRYPYQPGAASKNGTPTIALASECPEAQRIAKSVYMTFWQMKRKFKDVGEEDFAENFFGARR